VINIVFGLEFKKSINCIMWGCICNWCGFWSISARDFWYSSRNWKHVRSIL